MEIADYVVLQRPIKQSTTLSISIKLSSCTKRHFRSVGDKLASVNMDFVARIVGITMRYKPVSAACGLCFPLLDETLYHCSNDVNGNLGASLFIFEFLFLIGAADVHSNISSDITSN
jgi:hypothetical protein